MVIGGERSALQGHARRKLRASTEPPMVIGGELVDTWTMNEDDNALQRSRRW